MSEQTGIEWTDATWNPIAGCDEHSPGCKFCFAKHEAARQVRCAAGLKRETHYADTVIYGNSGPQWTGKIAIAPDHIWEKPLHWRKPKRVFVNSMSDLFHKDVPTETIDRAFATMAVTPHIEYQVLTKRSARMRAYLTDPATPRRVYELACDLVTDYDLSVVLIAPWQDPIFAPAGQRVHLDTWPLSNVWLGVSAEDQKRADERIPDLLNTPAAIRFVSAEPLLGPVCLSRIMVRENSDRHDGPWHLCWNALSGFRATSPYSGTEGNARLDWVIIGGESSRLKSEGVRPMHPDWLRSLIGQCLAADVKVFFKQWGDWVSVSEVEGKGEHHTFPDGATVRRVGAERAGNTIDGIKFEEFPTTRISA